MLITIPVREVMATDVVTVPPDATVREVARRLREEAVTSAVVCDGDRPVGILTESDLVEVLATGSDPDELAAEAMMSKDLVTVGPDTAIEEAAKVLAEHDFRRLPIVEDGELVGIVTVSDISYYLPHLAQGRRTLADRLRDHPSGDLPDVAYEDPGWHFEKHGENPNRVDVGDVVRFRKTVSEADVAAFAEATGDTNRLHLDEEFARRSRFGRPIAHGVLTAGLISAALARLPGLTIYLSQDLSFLAPAPIGATLTAVCEVVEDLGGRKFQLTTNVLDAADEPVLEGSAVVLVDDFPEAGGGSAGDAAAGAD